ncbi:MAG: hypothetical protein K9L59_14195 [Desulfobacterales bacterium]|jgi:hypothetical protein|nr:hypothetical protein [Desulfobacterales bacterium]
MDESKRKKIEAKLKELLAEGGMEKPKAYESQFNSGRTVTVIRRRKGKPDFQLA